MANETFTVSELIPASAERIYGAWLDGKEHAAMTGGGATGEGRVGGAFTSWDGYIRGTNVELVPGRRIVQSWRSNDFPEGAADSQVEIRLEPADGGTRITLVHSNVPEGQGADYEKGWREHYFAPMRKYFSSASTPVMPAPLPPPPFVHSPTPMPPADEWESAVEEKTVATPKPKAAAKPKAKAAAKPKAKAAAKPKAKAKTKAAAKPKKKIAAKAKAKPKAKAKAKAAKPKPKKKAAAAKPKAKAKPAKKKGARR